MQHAVSLWCDDVNSALQSEAKMFFGGRKTKASPKLIALNSRNTRDLFNRILSITLGSLMFSYIIFDKTSVNWKNNILQINTDSNLVFPASPEDSPRSFWWYHLVCWLLSAVGVVCILVAHEHYSVDVVVAYFITSRLFWWYHTMANLQVWSKDTGLLKHGELFS